FLRAENRGAMAINNSWGGPGRSIIPTIPNTFIFPNVISDAIKKVSTEGRGGKGVLVLFAAGNGDQFGEPILMSFGSVEATLPGVMAVGATMRNDRGACYGSF